MLEGLAGPRVRSSMNYRFYFSEPSLVGMPRNVILARHTNYADAVDCLGGTKPHHVGVQFQVGLTEACIIYFIPIA